MNDFDSYYDGAFPQHIRKIVQHGSYEAYCNAFATSAERNLSRRCADLVRSLCVWRMTDRYPDKVQNKMLAVISQGLFTARHHACEAYDIRNRF